MVSEFQCTSIFGVCRVLAMRSDFGVEVGASRRRMGTTGPGFQRRALADRFRKALALPPCPLLQLGVEDVFLQFGPVVVVDDLVMVLAVVTDRHGLRRACDRLALDEVPHLTVGRLVAGGGWVRSSESRNVVWDVAEAPRVVPDCSTLEWSQNVLFTVRVSRVVEGISDGPILWEASRRPIGARLVFEYEHSRFLLVGGEALRWYRRIQDSVAEYFGSRGGVMPSKPGPNPTTVRVSLRTSRVSMLVPWRNFLPRAHHLSLRRRSLRAGAAAGAGSRGSGVEIPLLRASSCSSSLQRTALPS